MKFQGLVRDLRRRHVFRVAALYLVSAWLLLQLGAILFPALGAPVWALRLLFGFLVLGFPVALILAWAFELTPEGVRRSESAEEPAPRRPEAERGVRRALNAAIVAVLAAAVALLAWRVSFEAPGPGRPAAAPAPVSATAAAATAAPENSIAVLPFVDLSPEGGPQYFAEGVSEQLLDMLAQATDLKVVARTSAFQFKGKPVDVRTIGKALDVRHVLEGSVRREGDQVRISVQLVDARTGYHEWSHTYERTMEGIFKVQDEITRTVAATLEARLAPGGRIARADEPTNPGAYEEYLLGRHFLNQRGTASLQAALAHFRRAIDRDPEYGPAYAQVAIVYTLLVRSSYGNYSRQQGLDLAKPYLDRAVALAPDAPDTQAAHGRYLMLSAGAEAALPHLERAVREDPSYMDAVNLYVAALDELGRHGEAWTVLVAAAHRDPLNYVINTNYESGLLLRQRVDEARAVAERFLTFDVGQGNLMLGDIDFVKGDAASAMRAYLKAYPALPGSGLASGRILLLLWYAGLDEDAYGLLVRTGPDYGGFFAAMMGQREQALKQTQAMLREDGDEARANVVAGNVDILLGRYAEAKRNFDRAFELVPAAAKNPFPVFSPDELTSYAALLFQAGESRKARKLLDRVRALIVRNHEGGIASGAPPDGEYAFRLASVQLLAGERDRGLSTLQKAVREARPADWPLYWRLTPLFLQRAPRFDSVRGDPRFQTILRQAERYRARVRAQILPVICHWKFAGSDWHPRPETCEGVATSAATAASA